MHFLPLLFSQKFPRHLKPAARNAESVSGFLAFSVGIFEVKPFYGFYFFFLQDQGADVHRLAIDVDKCDFFVAEHFAVEFFCKGDGEGSCELELVRGCLDAEFFVEFADCGLQGLIAGLDVACGGGVEFAGEGVFVLGTFLE